MLGALLRNEVWPVRAEWKTSTNGTILGNRRNLNTVSEYTRSDGTGECNPTIVEDLAITCHSMSAADEESRMAIPRTAYVV
jgi:hypothetical protein